MDKQQQQLIGDLLQRYADGQCTPEEEKAVRDWYNGLELSSRNPVEDDPVFAASAEQYLRNRLPGLPLPAVKKQPVIRRLYLRWAAAAAVLAVAVVGAWRFLSQPKQPAPATVTVMATDNTHKKRLVLPDGSVVWLNHNSSIEWNSRFGDTARYVQLSGEALFEVAGNAGKPFIVQAGNTSTRVLGTVFNIEAYTNEREIKLALLNGKVQFRSPGKPGTVLLPGKMVTYDKTGATENISAVSAEIASWTKGFTVFNEVPLDEAIERLALQNNWQLNWKRKTRPRQTVSAVFSSETPEQILQGLAFTHHLIFTIQKNKVTIF